MNSKSAQIRVASYNIRKCVGLDRRRDPQRVLSVLNGMDADLIALQEADKRLGGRPAALPKDLIEANSDYCVIRLPKIGASLGWHGNAILAKKTAVQNGAFGLSLPGLEPRGAIISELSIHGHDIRFVGLHLGLLRRHRRSQIAALSHNLAARRAMPTIVAGDFNEWFAQDLGFPGYQIYSPGHSFHTAKPFGRLDRIALNSSLGLLDAGVYAKGDAKIASDHLPIWADVNLAQALAFGSSTQSPATQASVRRQL